MPEILPLFPEPPRAAVERERPLGLNRECRRCELWRGARSVCMPADGQPGGVLIVGLYPGKTEDAVGRVNCGESGKRLRLTVARNWTGPIAYDNAIRCLPSVKVEARHVDACRGYLAQTLVEAAPVRVVALGQVGAQGVLGRKVEPLDVRRGFSWLVGKDKPVPVFFVSHPAHIRGNKFLLRWFEEDMRWALTQEPPFQPAWRGVAKVITSLEDALRAEKELTAAPWFAYDVEAAGVLHRPYQVLCGSCAVAGSDDVWVWDNCKHNGAEIRAVQARLLANPRARKVGSNFKYDEVASDLDLGIRTRGFRSDVRLKRKLLDADASGELEDMADLVGLGGHKEESQRALEGAIKRVKKIALDNKRGQLDLLGSSRGDLRPDVADDIRVGDEPRSFAYGLLPRDVRIRRNALDALATARLETLFESRFAEEPPALSRTWNRLVKPAAEAIRWIEHWGVAADRGAALRFHDYLTVKMDECRSRLAAYGSFNPDSGDQIADLLFTKLKLPVVRMTAGGKRPSTEDAVLEELAGLHPAIADLQAYRSYSKMDGTYALGMLRCIRPDGRIHGSLLLDGARTGRASMQNPNCQNIPRDADSPEGKMARDIIIAPPGKVLISADYSQMELRVAAALSGDPVMRQIFEAGLDIHQRTAEFIAPIVWKIPASQVTKAHRSATKSFIFGIIYGMSDAGVAARAHCSIEEARKIRMAVLGKLQHLAKWIQECLAYTRQHGVAWTWWDGEDARRRPLIDIAEIGKENSERRSVAERGSWNTRIQGTAAEFLTASMAAAVQWILEDSVPAKVELPVHDSLLLEADIDALPEVTCGIHGIMTRWNCNGVPLGVDLEIGHAWGSMVKIRKDEIGASYEAIMSRVQATEARA